MLVGTSQSQRRDSLPETWTADLILDSKEEDEPGRSILFFVTSLLILENSPYGLESPSLFTKLLRADLAPYLIAKVQVVQSDYALLLVCLAV